MAEQFKSLSESHIDFIKRQHIFFVGTAGKEGFVNVSPKGMDSFRVIDPKKVVWLNLTGSGNETAAHLIEQNRMTIMFCSFEKKPLILRLYGQAKTVHPRDMMWAKLSSLFPDYAGARQIFKLDLELAQTSCGYAVPLYDLKEERPTLTQWADRHDEADIEKYWRENNAVSLNNRKTNI